MAHSAFLTWSAALTVALVGAATATDLLWRRIPNAITLSSLILALVLRLVIHGAQAMAFGILGAILAPSILLMLHAGKRMGMGDIKLAAAIGAVFGPSLAIAAMILSAIAGGFLGLAMMLRPGRPLAELFSVLLIGFPGIRRTKDDQPAETDNVQTNSTMPYGVAIGIGSLSALAVFWWTGQTNWLFSWVTGAGNP